MKSRTKITKKDVFAPIYRGGKFSSKGQGNEESKRNWGEPLKITIALIDKKCPECNYSNGLSIGKEANGRIFGGMCHRCGWTFGFPEPGLSENRE